MRFARFRGPVKPNESLQIDKIYVSKLLLEDAGVVSDPDSGVHITDDSGVMVDIAQDARFDFPDRVYAAVCKKFDGKHIGDVVHLDGAFAEDMYQVIADTKHKTESGMVHRTNFIVLDHTNIGIGTEVLVRRSANISVWQPILGITNDLNVQIDKRGGFRSLTDFILPVSDGDIMNRPIVTCVRGDLNAELLEGGHYYLLQHSVHMTRVEVVNSLGDCQWYPASHFSGLFLPENK